MLDSPERRVSRMKPFVLMYRSMKQALLTRASIHQRERMAD
jgi:hypothetical protein